MLADVTSPKSKLHEETLLAIYRAQLIGDTTIPAWTTDTEKVRGLVLVSLTL